MTMTATSPAEREWTSAPEMLVLGTCCICEGERATAIVMLPVKNVVRGHGWGCVACGLAIGRCFRRDLR